MKTPKEWILVLNAEHARLIAGIADARSPAPSERVIEAEAHKLGEVMADKPGRSFSSDHSGRRASMSYASDPKRDAERAFVTEVVSMLEDARRDGEFDTLAIFAAPEMLGLLREQMSDDLRGVVSREVARNIAGMDAELLQDALRKEMAQS